MTETTGAPVEGSPTTPGEESEFVDAYGVSTGIPQRIPRHWLDHRVLGVQFTLEQPTAAEIADATPSLDWTRPELVKFAADHGVDMTTLIAHCGKEPTKAQILAAIQGQPIPDTTDVTA